MRRCTFDTDIARFNVDIGAVGFLMHREGFRNGNLFRGILPAFSMETDRASVNITYVPKIDPEMVALWFFQLKIRIGQY